MQNDDLKKSIKKDWLVLFGDYISFIFAFLFLGSVGTGERGVIKKK